MKKKKRKYKMICVEQVSHARIAETADSHGMMINKFIEKLYFEHLDRNSKFDN